MLALNGIVEDGHHHALPSVPPPPGLGDVHTGAAALAVGLVVDAVVVAAALWSKEWGNSTQPLGVKNKSGVYFRLRLSGFMCLCFRLE